MRVILAHAMGMCFGVRDALAMTRNVVAPESVTVHGELVHNEQVVDELQMQGFQVTGERDREVMPKTPQVMITAHGISNHRRALLQRAGKELLDTTCPLVARVHQVAMQMQHDGYHVLVIGRRGHVEVQGIIEDLRSFDVVEHVGQVRRYQQRRLGIVCQTTSSVQDVTEIERAIRNRNPHATIRFVDTVCQPTKDRQRAVEALLGRVDAMVVVGGANSNNTKQLVDLCRRRGIPVCQVQSHRDLDPQWLRAFQTIGLTAGASTLDATIREVHDALIAIPDPAFLAATCS